MKSRYGLWIVSLCWVGLTGCAGWKNQMGDWKPGSAATMAPPPPVAAGPGGSLLAAPGTSFNEPPPPMAPPLGDPNATLAPMGGPQKLDLSSVPDESPSRSVATSNVDSDKLYNMGGSSSKSESRKSSALSKLASAAGSPSKSEKAVASKSALSTVKKLSASAEKKSEETVEKEAPKAEAAAPAKVNAAEPAKEEALPAPAPATAAAPAPAPAASTAVDTTLLAQPVRKGTTDDKPKDDSKGPQSSLLPDSKFFNGKKPMIYPVSNPVADEPVEAVRFS